MVESDKQAAAIQQQNNRQADDAWWTRAFAGLTVLVGLGQLVVYLIQARRLRETIDKMDEIAKAQGEDTSKALTESARAATAMENTAGAMSASATAAGANAVSAAANAQAAAANAQISAENLAAIKIIERAYVNLSHEQPGLTFVYPPDDAIEPTFNIQFTTTATNSGNTPAGIIASDIRLVYGPKGMQLPANPSKPPLPSNLDPVFTLMPRERNHFWRNYQRESRIALERVQFMAHATFVVGWILYKDKFGQLHRSGYARQFLFNPDGNVNNLIFVEQPGYNYDEDL